MLTLFSLNKTFEKLFININTFIYKNYMILSKKKIARTINFQEVQNRTLTFIVSILLIAIYLFQASENSK